MTILQLYPRPHPQTAGRVIDGEAVLILSDNSEINILNRVGSRLFELADGSRSVEQLISIIVAEFDVSWEQAEQDVSTFFADMARRDVFILNEGPI
jgi:hypothetical protein